MNKRIKIILLILILILLVLIVRSTYSKYTVENQAAVSEKIAKWVIKINDTDITAQRSDTNFVTNPNNKDIPEISFDITGADVEWDTDSHVTEGKVVPGMKGYFYLRIDPTDTQTAIKYTIDMDMSSIIAEHINFKINKISVEGEKDFHAKDPKDGLYTIQRIKEMPEIKSTDDNIKIDRIKVELEWVNSETTDRFDTQVGETVDKQFQIPIHVHAIQYTGEGYDF